MDGMNWDPRAAVRQKGWVAEIAFVTVSVCLLGIGLTAGAQRPDSDPGSCWIASGPGLSPMHCVCMLEDEAKPLSPGAYRAALQARLSTGLVHVRTAAAAITDARGACGRSWYSDDGALIAER